MKYTFFLLCALMYCLISPIANAQQNTVSTGGVAIGVTGSVSYTIGQLDYLTANGSGGTASQGIQQVYKFIVNLKAYLQGYYAGGGMMQPVLANQGQINGMTDVDTITIELHQATYPYSLAHSYTGVLQTNGTITCTFPNASEGQSYYIVVKHRNTLETWSAQSVVMNSNTNYDFTSASTQAFNGNQVEVESGVWAFYSGDFNQDENIDLIDLSIQQSDINSFQFGYFSTDINGDGNVDLLDSSPVESNVNAFIYAAHP